MKILKPFIGTAVVVSCIGFGYMLKEPAVAVQKEQATVVVAPSPLTAEDLATATNAERTRAGLPTVQLDPDLNSSAMDKCNDMTTRNYWSHNTPDGVEPWSFILKYTKYQKAGENLAKGYDRTDTNLTAWMSSPTHKDNILNPSYNYVGFGICKYSSGTPLVVQHFIQSF